MNAMRPSTRALERLVDIAGGASARILPFYVGDAAVELKDDGSPVTQVHFIGY